MKTIKQIADELGIPKQKVYRYVKQNHINEAHRSTSVIQFDDAVVNLIIKHFSKVNKSNEARHDSSKSASSDALFDAQKDQIEILKNQIQMKDQQIDTLLKQMENMQVLLKMEKDTVIKLQESKKTIFKRFLSRKKENP